MYHLRRVKLVTSCTDLSLRRERQPALLKSSLKAAPAVPEYWMSDAVLYPLLIPERIGQTYEGIILSIPTRTQSAGEPVHEKAFTSCRGYSYGKRLQCCGRIWHGMPHYADCQVQLSISPNQCCGCKTVKAVNLFRHRLSEEW